MYPKWKAGINKMADTRKCIIIKIILKIVLILIVIVANCLLLRYFNTNNSASVVGIIGGADGPTTIYISSRYGLIANLILTLSIFFVVSIIVLLVYDIIELKKSKKYDTKYKFKIILAIDLSIIISVIIQIVFNLLAPALSVFLNITLIAILFIIIYFAKVKKQKERAENP